jgi:chemotaxis protein MotA
MSFLLGLLLCAAAFAFYLFGGADAARLLDTKALLFVTAGTIGAAFITSPMQTLLRDLSCIAQLLGKKKKPEQMIAQIVTLVKTARREGILSLEGLESGISDPILKKGIVLLTGSADRDTVEDILVKDSQYFSAIERSAQEFVERIAFLSPGIGMIATLVELAQMLYTYKGPETLAPGVANALIPVVYAGLIAYLILFPLSSRVKAGSERRRQRRELAIQGVLAIQAGEPPFVVEQRLLRFADGRISQLEQDEE